MKNATFQKVGLQRVLRSNSTGQFVSQGKSKLKKRKEQPKNSLVKNGSLYLLNNFLPVRALQVCNNNLRLVSCGGNLFGFVKDSQLTSPVLTGRARR